MVKPINYRAYAVGKYEKNGFRVRRVVWGRILAQAERRDDEEIRSVIISLEPHRRELRHPVKNWKLLPLELRQRWWKETDYGRIKPSPALAAEIRSYWPNKAP